MRDRHHLEEEIHILQEDGIRTEVGIMTAEEIERECLHLRTGLDGTKAGSLESGENGNGVWNRDGDGKRMIVGEEVTGEIQRVRLETLDLGHGLELEGVWEGAATVVGTTEVLNLTIDVPHARQGLHHVDLNVHHQVELGHQALPVVVLRVRDRLVRREVARHEVGLPSESRQAVRQNVQRALKMRNLNLAALTKPALLGSDCAAEVAV
ncbi:hypothetical protein EUX98_g1199 [Antrodiella citrinella]|uniref:Uncharacterized protein n=1 Tax=Antrodiella citrinella TaxID=2447956 RepID=A0A4S4N240_9APHY|nr:hypothetical protein EUX98_g1199 [Antrodiella citrinella]